MNGAESLVRMLVASGVDTCFANPGTSEMHFVSALDRIDGMRSVLGLFGFARKMPACVVARLARSPATRLRRALKHSSIFRANAIHETCSDLPSMQPDWFRRPARG